MWQLRNNNHVDWVTLRNSSSLFDTQLYQFILLFLIHKNLYSIRVFIAIRPFHNPKNAMLRCQCSVVNTNTRSNSETSYLLTATPNTTRILSKTEALGRVFTSATTSPCWKTAFFLYFKCTMRRQIFTNEKMFLPFLQKCLSQSCE